MAGKKKTYKKHQKQVKKKVEEKKEISRPDPKRPILTATIKISILLLIIGLALFYSDKKGYFNPDQSNNHTKKKWDSFYSFTKKNNVDVLLMGNSHLYSGVSPKNLTAALGANCFILASPGTHINDTYFGLKEALKSCSPSLVIIETYGISSFNPYKMEEGELSDQFKSFSARKNIPLKAASTPYLFSIENYPYAWSNTVRNHDYLFTNPEQLKKNKTLREKEELEKKGKRKREKLYLGRFVRFQTGIEDSTMNKYKEQGAAVNGSEYNYNKHAASYVDKIIKLCQKENIELMFLTIPMFSKHVENYPAWKNTLAEVLDQYPKKWYDLQDSSYYNDFPPYCFENTYATNQHLTYRGSLIVTYKLARFIQDELNVKLPNRTEDKKWHRLFYAEEGYFENYPATPKDTNNLLLAKDQKFKNGITLELLSLKNKDNKNRRLVAKINREQYEKFKNKSPNLLLAVTIKHENQLKNTYIKLYYDKFHQPASKAVFATNIKPVEIVKVLDGVLK